MERGVVEVMSLQPEVYRFSTGLTNEDMREHRFTFVGHVQRATTCRSWPTHATWGMDNAMLYSRLLIIFVSLSLKIYITIIFKKIKKDACVIVYLNSLTTINNFIYKILISSMI